LRCRRRTFFPTPVYRRRFPFQEDLSEGSLLVIEFESFHHGFPEFDKGDEGSDHSSPSTVYMAILFMMSVILGLMLLQQLEIASPPHAPMDTVASGIVILEGAVNPQGRLTDIRMIHGMPPFIQPSLQAVRDWTFAPVQGSPHVSVTFFYRARNIFPDSPYEFNLRNPSCALPIHVVNPGYPINAIGEGSVILQVHTDPQGVVEGVDVIRSVPSLTEAAVQAVRRWTFTGDGPATGVVVISFLRPVLPKP